MFLSPLVLVAAAASSPGPSFACARAGTKVERLICGDERLAAYDRALALLYRRARQARSGGGEAEEPQRVWIERERGRCPDAACLARAYQTRIAEMAERAPSGWGALFVSRENHGDLEIAPLGGEWHLVRVTAIWVYPGGGNANDGEATGVVRLHGGKGELASGECRLALDGSGAVAWRVRELGSGSDIACGGHNVTLTGIYRRSR